MRDSDRVFIELKLNCTPGFLYKEFSGRFLDIRGILTRISALNLGGVVIAESEGRREDWRVSLDISFAIDFAAFVE